MKFNNRFIGFVVCYLVGVGSGTVTLTLFNAIFEFSKYEQAIAAITVSVIPVAAATVLLLREGLDSVELWARRILNAVFNMTCVTLTFAAFGVLNTPEKMALSFALGLAVNFLLNVPLFIILDRRNKRKLEEINKKLKENSENEQI